VISYAQNLEDVLLSRALAGVDHGYYVDVGAFDPDVDSVTRHFYDAGWCGINIEPVADQLALFARVRPRDINLNVALGRTNGTLTFHDFSPLGVSTLDPVVVLTLAQVCRDHDVRAIDFLKIDVEGHETEVLAGHDWNFVRPRILLVEATRPMSATPSYDAWEPMILHQGYLFAWFDGLNRYYLRREDADLLAHFRIPPNIFDGYVVASRDSSGQLLAALASRIKRQLLRR
jgi:FkbM family methyltransferase